MVAFGLRPQGEEASRLSLDPFPLLPSRKGRGGALQ